MTFEAFRTKPSVAIAYTGDCKGKTTAGIGLMVRALGHGDRVAFIQFVKSWHVSEHTFIDDIRPLYGNRLFFYKGGRGFYAAGELSAKNVSEADHRQAALDTYNEALRAAISGDYNVVICDEINNVVHDGLLTINQLRHLITDRADHTSLCLTGRNFPPELSKYTDIVTEMRKIKHHYDEKYLANEGIDY